MEEQGQPGKILPEMTCGGTIITVDNIAVAGPSRRKVKDMAKTRTASAARDDTDAQEKLSIAAPKQAI